MYRNLTYLLENGAFPWADRSLTCQLKNRQVSSLTGFVIFQGGPDSLQFTSQSTDRGRTRFQSSQNLHWAVVGVLHFLNRRWLLAGLLCNFSVLPDISSLWPIIYVLLYRSKWQSFWVRDYNFLHTYTQSSGPNLSAPHSQSLCDRSVKGLRGTAGRQQRGLESACGYTGDTKGPESVFIPETGPPLLAKLDPMIPNCKSHLGLASLSAPLLLPAADGARHFCLRSYQHPHCTPFISLSYICRHMESFAHNCQVAKGFCLHHR